MQERKIDIYVRGQYGCSTNRHTRCKDAKARWLEIYHSNTQVGARKRQQYPAVQDHEVVAAFDPYWRPQ